MMHRIVGKPISVRLEAISDISSAMGMFSHQNWSHRTALVLLFLMDVNAFSIILAYFLLK